MKVLIAYPDDKLIDNPFVRTLIKGLESLGCDVSWGLTNFWQNASQFDIINFQWPDSVFQYWSPTDDDIALFENHLIEIKKRSKIIYTRHNEAPHYALNTNKQKAYDLVEKNADAIVHLGNVGIAGFKEKIRNDKVKHFIIPHHIYENEYDLGITKKLAREKLNIPMDKFVVLTFGAYRDMEEANMVLSEFKDLKIKNKYLLAPRLNKILFPEAGKKYSVQWMRDKVALMKLKMQNVYPGSDFVADDSLSYYFAATDLVLIQRKKLLNSGNILLAFLFKKPVVGPGVGNAGELLKETKNILFNPNLRGDLTNALIEAEKLSHSELGQNNFNYAIEYLNIKTVAQKYLDVYKNVLAE